MKSHDPIDGITMRNVELIARIEAASKADRTLGEKVADLATRILGSWWFLITQSVLLVVWMALNVSGQWHAWDPYPFILLNLALSFQAAFATPMILMSQNRQALLDLRREELDLQINLLTEQENTQQLKLLRLICERMGIELTESDEATLEQATDPNKILRQIIGVTGGQ